MEYEIKLETGKVVRWEGKDGFDAATRAKDCLSTRAVAVRPVAHGLFIYNHNYEIIE